MFAKYLPLLFLLLTVVPAAGQLSHGGKPVSVPTVKSARTDAFRELTIPDEELELVRQLQAQQNSLKAFRFAYAIPVDMNLQNSGEWFTVGNLRVWQLRLSSPGALSLNVIFDRYRLPQGARLFLFSEDQNDLIGAFTSANNKANGQLATMPVAGDRLVVQYEEPVDAEFSGELQLKSVNHDFVGLKAANGGRRPLGESGSCNVNVNCDYLQDYRQAANAVCRILIDGTELCTGSLLNNTDRDGTPYVYTAHHCIVDADEAAVSVFLFNYESPYCGNIDGEVQNSLSGSLLKATSDELDFSLVELSVAPPKSFQPYYLGWDHSSKVPDSTVAIHHPLGDIKKLAVDRDAPIRDSYTRDYVDGAFWRIAAWDEGTTEAGSSGAALIDPTMHVRGSLVGGDATCSSPVDDYFSQFAYAWDYYAESSRQLKAWLDPSGTGTSALSGYNPYISADQCTMVTNLSDEDELDDGLIDADDGYYSGTNSYGFSAFAEAFRFTDTCKVQGLALGISRAVISSNNARLTLSVYAGESFPEGLLYSQDFDLSGLDEGVMNYFRFDREVSTNGYFYLSWSVEDLGANDEFAVYLADRTSSTNSFFIRDGEEWYSYPQKANTAAGSAAVMETLVCFHDDQEEFDPFVEQDVAWLAYPNPLAYGQDLTIHFEADGEYGNVQVFDLVGKSRPVNYSMEGTDRVLVSFAGYNPGIYLVRLRNAATGEHYQCKVLYLGND
ncbi:T9SS type A sorting domain-containing protein [Mangrovibacterium marinum]|uniref:Putative secreted protein (Por secretion system target) n=1 Tax=Mangrovibacterium marinum TaxID=1639118 RepID=A0A2T5BY92_9BACT|nr:trypsin-like peptidase domain-containing protein [Mangrovibacterium marinum]PTN06770.1 putative secreted protein (Por secretion system target) [Mangrovibacterium marinum]